MGAGRNGNGKFDSPNGIKLNNTQFTLFNETGNNQIKLKLFKTLMYRAVPTTVIDGEIRVEGILDFPWICGSNGSKI